MLLELHRLLPYPAAAWVFRLLFPLFRMYKYTSSRFKTRAEQEVKKAEHVARIGNVHSLPPGQEVGSGWGCLGDTSGQSRIQKKLCLASTQGQVLLNHWSSSSCTPPLACQSSQHIFPQTLLYQPFLGTYLN